MYRTIRYNESNPINQWGKDRLLSGQQEENWFTGSVYRETSLSFAKQESTSEPFPDSQEERPVESGRIA